MMVITGMCSGGAERVMSTLCNEFSQRHEVRLLSMRPDDSDYALAKAVQFVRGNVRNKSLIKSVRFTRAQMKAWKPDVVLSFMTKSNIIALLAGMFWHRPPLVIAERANPYNAQKIFVAMRRVLYPMANGVVFQTRQAQDYYKNILKCPSVVLRNPLNPDFDLQPFTGERRRAIVTMGRLSSVKNQRMLIDAFARIAPDYPDYSLEIYGEGPERARLEAQISALGLEGRAKLMGRKDRVQQYVQDASLFVLPSNSEGMPNALIEAMAMGLPSIATDCPIGGSAAVVQHGQNGLLLPMNDVEGLAAAMRAILGDAELARKLGRNAAKVVQDFSAKTVCAQWEAYLSEMTEG